MYPAPCRGPKQKQARPCKDKESMRTCKEKHQTKSLRDSPSPEKGSPKDEAIEMKTRFNLAQPAENTLSWAKRAKFYLSCPTERLRNRSGPRVTNGNSR